MEYYNRLNHLRFKSPYLGAKYQQRVIPVRTLNGVQDVFVDNRGTIKQGGHTHSKLYNYSNRNRTHPIKGAYAREVDSWNNNTSPIKALVNSGIGYALAPAAQAVYPYKDIPVYENTETLDFFTKKPMQKASNITNKTPWKGANNNLDFGDNGVDAAGHLVQEGISNGKKVYRAQDIWKFNPDEYKQKWSSYDLDSKAVLGLKILDKLGTPVIVRTPWLYR